MSPSLADPVRAGVFQLTGDAREIVRLAEAGGLAVHRIDIGRVHDKSGFLRMLAQSLNFPQSFGANWDALSDSLKDLSWTDAPGWVILLEKSKHFCAGHGSEFSEAMDIMVETADFWRGEGRPFWTLIGGPEGWDSGWPELQVV
jgi:RNAse (barnase) inhibitor barstar